MHEPLYHFTDSARLPWILRSGELQPGRNLIGGYPGPDFLWATTDPRGDATSSAHRGERYRSGEVRQVRFTLDAADFRPWAKITDDYPQWTVGQIARLEAAAEGRSSPSTWWCRPGPLSLEVCGLIETKSYMDNRWVPLERATEVRTVAPDWLVVSIGSREFASRQVVGPYQSVAYELRAGR